MEHFSLNLDAFRFLTILCDLSLTRAIIIIVHTIKLDNFFFCKKAFKFTPSFQNPGENFRNLQLNGKIYNCHLKSPKRQQWSCLASPTPLSYQTTGIGLLDKTLFGK